MTFKKINENKSKLVRDKIPEFLSEQDLSKISTLEESDSFKYYLIKKLFEETNELLSVLDIENHEADELLYELSDLYEVLDTICQTYNVSKDQLRTFQEIKRTQKGAFEKKLILDNS